MKILVTGGAGYIGSIVTEQLIKGGADVVVFDNLSTGHRGAVHPDAAFVHGDLTDHDAVKALFAAHEISAIMHFASLTLVGESMAQPLRYFRQNGIGALNLLETAVAHGVRRFILSSTANLFDDPERVPIAADERIVPGSVYGETKYHIERYLHWLDRLYDFRYAALRYFNAAGASSERGEDHRPEHHLIPLILQVARGQREHITIFGDDYNTEDGTCIRDYIHVLDLAQAHIMALNALDQGSRVYNLGSGAGFSVQEIVETARRVTGRSIPTVIGPRRAGDPDILIADSRHIRDDLGWQPRHSDLANIISSAWQWHLNRPEGYES